MWRKWIGRVCRELGSKSPIKFLLAFCDIKYYGKRITQDCLDFYKFYQYLFREKSPSSIEDQQDYTTLSFGTNTFHLKEGN